MESVSRTLIQGIALTFLLMIGTVPRAALSQTYTVELENVSGDTLSNVPVSFGHPFAPGEISAGQSLTGNLDSSGAIDIQVDKKATHADGSLKHAIVSMIVPEIRAGRTVELQLSPSSTSLSGAPVALSELEGSGETVEVELDIGGSTYRASLRDALSSPISQWIAGPIASEWITEAPFVRVSDNSDHPHLKARFYARKYSGSNNVKVDVVVENMATFVGTRTGYRYAATISVNGSVVYSKGAFDHYRNTRWKYTIWTNGNDFGMNAPAILPVNVRFDPAALMASGAVPTYDYNLIFRVTGLGYRGHREENITDHGGVNIDRYGPMGRGANSYNGMSTTGGRGDIAPLPIWAVRWLLSQDHGAWLVMIRNSDLSGSWGTFYRDENTGLPVTIDTQYGGYPRFANQDRFNPNPGLAPSASGSGTPLRPDTSHQPQFDFLPYLVTGDFFHLEQLEFWNAWNLADQNPGEVAAPNTATSDGYRNEHMGYVVNRGQVRGRAWTLRTMAMMASFAPDDYYTKPYWMQLVNNNLVRFKGRWIGRNNYGWMGGIEGPWMHDYVSWSLGYVAKQGFALAVEPAEWSATFAAARMGEGGIGSQWCWQAAAAFGFEPYENHATINDWWAAHKPAAQGVACGTPQMAQALGLSGSGDMTGRPYSESSYVAQFGPALATAVDLGLDGAERAWAIYSGSSGDRTVFPQDLQGEPQWAIIPTQFAGSAPARPENPGRLR